MQWIFKNGITILLVACSAGQKNTAINSEGVQARTIDSNITSPMDEKTTNDLSWKDLNYLTNITLGAKYSSQHLASDSLGSTLVYSIDFEKSDCDEQSWIPSLKISSDTGIISGTLLESEKASCFLFISARSEAEEITKPLTLNIIEQNLLSSISEITLIDPTSSPSYLSRPSFSVSPVSEGDEVSIYSDSNCNQLIGTASATSTSASVRVSKELADGSYSIHALFNNAKNSSKCSIASVSYVVDSEIPQSAKNLSFPLTTNDITSSPPLSWEQSPTENVNYKVSLGTSKGAKDVVNELDVADVLNHTVVGLSLDDCVAIYPSIHTYSSVGKKGEDLVSETPFYFDTIAPSAPSSLSLVGYHMWNTSPTINWSPSTDNCSSQVTHMVALGTSTGDDSLVAWTASDSNEHVFENININIGEVVFLSVKATDEGGLESEISSLSYTVPGPPDQILLGIDSVASDSVALAWTEPDANNRPINDYKVEYRETGVSQWLIFEDGVSSDPRVEVTGLQPSLSYDFRVTADNGEESDPSIIVSATTQVDDDFFDDSNFKVMNVGGATSSQLVALEDSTTVTLVDGSTTVSLDKGETHSFSSSLGDIVSSDKPFYVAGRLARDNTDLRKANIVWSPPHWAGYDFIFNTKRYAPHVLTAFMFEEGNLLLTRQNDNPVSYSFSAGEFKTIILTDDTNYYVSSNSSTLLFIHSRNPNGELYADPRPILPASNEIIGFASTTAEISVDTDSTSIAWYVSDGMSGSETAMKSAPVSHEGTGPINAEHYSGYASRYLSSGGLMAGSSVADGNGNCSATFLPVAMMKKRYAINTSADWVAFASTEPAVISYLAPDGTSGSITLSRSGIEPMAPFYARLTNQEQGTVYTSDDRYAAWYEPNTDAYASSLDETILFGYD